MGYLSLDSRPSNIDFCMLCLVRSPLGPILSACSPFTGISNAVHCDTSVNRTSVDSSPSSSRSYSTFHPGRVVAADCHDIDAWTQERKAHDTKQHPVAAPPSPGFSGTIGDDCSPVDMARSKLAPMEFLTRGLRDAEEFPDAVLLPEDAVTPCSHKWTYFVPSNLDAFPTRTKVTNGSCLPRDLSEGRRRVGEILVQCGVIDISGLSLVPPATNHDYAFGKPPDDPFVVFGGTFKLPSDDDELFAAALADWTSEWVHALVIQPYIQGTFRFQFQGKPSGASSSVAPRIRRVLSAVSNPVQVVIHAIWFLGTLTGKSGQSNAAFLSIPIFRYLHNNGTFVAEDFMFHTFVACAMIGDKAVNDVPLSTSTWNRLTRVPQVVLNATEKHALSCLKWNVVMTGNQWQETIGYLRSCIKMGSTFDPFAYDETSPSGIMARYLDGLISDANEQTVLPPPGVEILAPQPIRHSTHWEVFDTPEWCPEVDPVINQKPRNIGIAPGTDGHSKTHKAGMTAKDLLDTILGSSKVPNLGHLAHPAGTSFCGSFGAIGARFAQTVKLASTCQSTSWFPSHG